MVIFMKVTSFEGVLRVFQGSFIDEEVLGRFRGRFMIFMGVCRVFKKSFKLYGTHRSFPSRRRACFELSAEIFSKSITFVY